MLRLISWNIENLAPSLGLTAPRRRAVLGQQRPHLSEMVARLGGADVLCLQEIRVRPQDAATLDAMRSALPGYTCHYALCEDAQNGRFRGGRAYGVAIYARAALHAESLARPAWDREGRVIGVALPSLSLAVLNVYAVNGTDRPHFDHEQGAIVGDRHGFKRRFQADLIDYLQRLRRDYPLLLAGDWNISRCALDTWPRLRAEYPHDLARSMFNETLLPALDVVDVFRERHPDTRAYTWFNRAAKAGTLDAARVDFWLVSRALLAGVSEAEILDDPAQRFHSDHAPVVLHYEAAGS